MVLLAIVHIEEELVQTFGPDTQPDSKVVFKRKPEAVLSLTNRRQFPFLSDPGLEMALASLIAS